MVSCQLCSSPTQDSYLFTECQHFVCTYCSSQHWDGKYALRCCNRITFLEETTCEVLRRMNRAKSESDESQNEECLPVVLDRIKETPHKRVNSPRAVTIPKESAHFEVPAIVSSLPTNESAYQPSYEPLYDLQPTVKPHTVKQAVSRVNQSGLDEKGGMLREIQEAMKDEVEKVRASFEIQRKQLERREQETLREVYESFAHHLKRIDLPITLQSQAAQLVHELKTSIKEPILVEEESVGSTTPCKGYASARQQPAKPDRILQRLEYNQLKMQEKLQKHYQMLQP